MSAFVRFKGTAVTTDTAPAESSVTRKQPYTAFRIADATAQNVAFFDGNGVEIPAALYNPGVWHYLEFSAVKTTGTAAASVQVGVLVRTGIQSAPSSV